MFRSTIEALENKLQQWSEFEQLKDQCLSWLRETDTKLHAVDLKATVKEKRNQLEMLKKIQGEVRAKELEIDSATEKAQQLFKGRNSSASELGVKYQQLSAKIKVKFYFFFFYPFSGFIINFILLIKFFYYRNRI